MAYIASFVFGFFFVAGIIFTVIAIRQRIEVRRTRNRLYKLCAVSSAYGPFLRPEVRKRANVA